MEHLICGYGGHSGKGVCDLFKGDFRMLNGTHSLIYVTDSFFDKPLVDSVCGDRHRRKRVPMRGR
jgi:hypothetical protein